MSAAGWLGTHQWQKTDNINVGKDMEQLEFLYAAGENIKWDDYLGKLKLIINLAVNNELNIFLLYDQQFHS